MVRIPTEIGLLSGLVTLTLPPSYELSGTLPTEIGQLKSLVRFTAKQTGLSGTIPTELAELTNLGILYVLRPGGRKKMQTGEGDSDPQ